MTDKELLKQALNALEEIHPANVKPMAWAHLPNAKHIDRVLASLETNPEKWTAAWRAEQTVECTAAQTAAQTAAITAAQTAAQTAAWYTAWAAARSAAETAAKTAAGYEAWDEAGYAAWGTVMDAAQGAIAALVAWDDCAYMLELPDDNLKELREAGNKPALLLSAAANVLNLLKETS